MQQKCKPHLTTVVLEFSWGSSRTFLARVPRQAPIHTLLNSHYVPGTVPRAVDKELTFQGSRSESTSLKLTKPVLTFSHDPPHIPPFLWSPPVHLNALLMVSTSVFIYSLTKGFKCLPCVQQHLKCFVSTS